MGRNIKFYNGSYIAQTSNYWDASSTGYTVPSGKVARIGFDIYTMSGCVGGTSERACAGFFAGTNGAGSTSTGNQTNRFLMVYTPGTESNNISGTNLNLHYNPSSGHKWMQRSYEGANPQVYLGDSQRERYTSRSTSTWYRHNFWYSGSNSTTQDWGLTGWSNGSSGTVLYQRHLFKPMYDRNNDIRLSDSGFINGAVHAFAGETIYIFDWAYNSYTTWDYRPFGKCQWSMFVIEEDA